MIDEVFGPEGLFAQKFSGYEPRKGQVDMAAAVERAVAKGEHLIVEGPTGTGKSVAYLVPAILHAQAGPPPDSKSPRRRVIVVTGNIALQEQLVEKDLPLLREILPKPFTYALAKGKNNYVCVDALGKALAETGGVGGKSLMGKGDQLARLIEWAQTTKTGDVSEFPETPSPGAWKRLSVSSEECKGSGCKWFEHCFSERAKRAAMNADVIVTNYHMFFAHLVVREKMQAIRNAGGQVEVDVVLPPATVVVFDEAHKAADIARDFLGFQVSSGSIEWLVRGFNHELADETRHESQKFFAQLLQHRKSRAYKARLKKGHPIDGERLASVLQRVSKFYKDSVSAGAWSPDEKAELETRSRRGATVAAQIRQAMRPEEHEGTAFFLEEVERGAGVVLKSKPIDVSDWLRAQLFEPFQSVVVTSATLATSAGKGPFDFVRKELGMEGGAELLAESPFRWDEQVLLVIPDTVADPKGDRATFNDSVGAHVRDCAKAAKGRTLGLFTSYQGLDAAHRECQRLPYQVFRQGEAPRTLLIKKFKEDVSSILLGCESFWAGVDVPGESLSCVVIDRLPFPTPDDPIVDAISERDDRWFFNYAVPRAIIALKQGFGRLIRTSSDRGCVVILDRRVVTTGYGREFLRALPKVKMANEVADVARFLEAG